MKNVWDKKVRILVALYITLMSIPLIGYLLAPKPRRGE